MITRLRWQDPPTHVRWESVRLGEPIILARPWFRPRLEHEDGTPLPSDGKGAHSARGADGRPVRVTAQYDLLRAGRVLHVAGRPVPSTGAVSRSAGLGLLAVQFAVFVVGGYIGLVLAHITCDEAVAVLRCDGDPSVRRSQAATVAVAGACATAAVITLGALVSTALEWNPLLFGLLWSATD